VGAHYT